MMKNQSTCLDRRLLEKYNHANEDRGRVQSHVWVDREMWCQFSMSRLSVRISGLVLRQIRRLSKPCSKWA